ncbi:MAG: tRNA (adenosine(37)-N6)-threonylcarbamoyltransferase complex ATPase subunit type 1 TsaE [Schleiferiaceae bacterium]|nr:tRNA (adenosine(37)-N6)-threonylcarbamoyltransferase complex ATPase subunit type 1 TsaE [Schleiferiaceae bacterium]
MGHVDLICTADEWLAWAERHKAELQGPVAILGSMGSGKTTAVKHWLQAFGSPDKGSSPTFTLIKVYDSPQGLIYHADFYRLDKEEEAEDLGLDEIFDARRPIWMEWPQKIPNLLPEETVVVLIEVQKDGCRKVTLHPEMN